MTKLFNIAIVGATGLVGSTVLALLAERNFPCGKIFLLASKRSAGKAISFKNQSLHVCDIANFDFSQTQFSFFCVDNHLAAQYAPIAAAAGNFVLDKSSKFRYQDDIPLIVPEVNFDALQKHPHAKIIASPNCNTIPLAVALKPVYDAVGITRINVATYQSVSGAGRDAIDELNLQSRQILQNETITPKIFSQQIAFNTIPQIDQFEKNGYTREEMKMVWEMKKIFSDDAIAINPTAVRVPVLVGHAAAVHLETRDKLTLAHARDLLSSAQHVTLLPGQFSYPTQAKDSAGRDNVFVGRLREDISLDLGFNMWIVADNLRKGAALNAIQIAEQIINDNLI